MSARRRAARAACAGASALVCAPGVAHACAVCSVLANEANRLAYFDTTIVLSLLPLGLIAGGLWWLARKAKGSMAGEFRESDEDLPAPLAETPRG